MPDARDRELESAEAALRKVEDLPQLTRTAARAAADMLGAPGCAISRVIGDVLIELAEYAGTRPTLYLGHGYLVSDYPLTREAIEQRETRIVFAGDPGADAQEVSVLTELGFEALLMVPICVGDDVWGLAEIYDEGGRRFDEQDAEAATRLFSLVGELVAQFEAAR